MARVVVTICDACQSRGEEDRPATRHKVTIDGKSIEVDLCDEDYGAIFAPLLQLRLPTSRRAAKKAPARKAPVALASVPDPPDGDVISCPNCTRTFPTEERRNRHVGQAHRRARKASARKASSA